MHYVITFLFMAWICIGFVSAYTNYKWHKKEDYTYTVADFLCDVFLGPVGSFLESKLYDPEDREIQKDVKVDEEEDG